MMQIKQNVAIHKSQVVGMWIFILLFSMCLKYFTILKNLSIEHVAEYYIQNDHMPIKGLTSRSMDFPCMSCVSEGQEDAYRLLTVTSLPRLPCMLLYRLNLVFENILLGL